MKVKKRNLNGLRAQTLVLAIALALSAFTLAPPALKAQSLERFERDRALLMLNIVKSDLKNNYYDPNFHGMDLDARFKTAESADLRPVEVLSLIRAISSIFPVPGVQLHHRRSPG